MRSLFAKILLWFLATIAIALVGFVVTAAVQASAWRPRQLPFSMLVTLQMTEARIAYETGGRQALAETLDRFRRQVNTIGVLTDGSGRDLLTGEDRGELIRTARRGRTWPFFVRDRVVIARPDEDGRYWYLLTIQRTRWFNWFLHPQYLWIAGLVVLLCYLLALHLTSPLRRLQRVVDRFGQGDLRIRARTGGDAERLDEVGDLARAFDRMADRIQTLLGAERRLLLDISHELRSPLARLGVAVELARSGEDRDAALNRIQREADRLNALVAGLLQVTRAEGDPASLHAEKVRLDALIAQVAEDVEIEARARGCSLEIETPELTIRGDAELLRRAVENVVRNAIRYAPAGTPVQVGAARSNGVVRVTVRDHGPGAPEEALPRLFDAFYRVEADRNRSSGGVGLGLAIARRAVELHRGQIRAVNASPGLRVEIDLPATSS